MNQRLPQVVGGIVAAALLASGCAPAIPQEQVPAGWELNVHQAGEWWTQPLIPRAVVLQRCPQQPGWWSEPDLSRVTALPSGIDVNYSFWTDDYHCDIGWTHAPSQVRVAPAERRTEAGLRRICSASGLRLDDGWRYLGHNRMDQGEDRPGEVSTAAFVDQHGTVVGCLVGYDLVDHGIGADVELSVGVAAAPTTGSPACPVTARNLARAGDGTVATYELRGAGAVRGDDGRVLRQAATLRIGLAGDTVTTSHPVVDGIAIVHAAVEPKAAIALDWDRPPAVEGEILDGGGTVLASCRG